MNQTAANRVSDTIARLDKKPAPRKWRVTQGPSTGTIVAPTYEDAKQRAAQIGFKTPDSIVLIEDNPPSHITCKNEHEALGMALGMLERIAEGRSYDASEYHTRLGELKRHYDREQHLIEIDIYNPKNRR
jgi:hypothetical protein